MTALATTNGTHAALALPVAAWEEKIDIIKDQVCRPKDRPASDSELGLFLHVCRMRRLDPLTKQIYAQFRWDSLSGKERMTIITSIDGFRLNAERSGKYAGQVGPHWCGEDGVWHDVWLHKGYPTAAKVGVIRSDFKEPVFAVARFDAYVQCGKDGKPNRMWATMPDNQLAKCAEALALRRAFPEEMGGLHTNDEIRGDTDDNPDAPPAQRATPARPVEAVLEPVHDGTMPPKQPGAAEVRAAVRAWSRIRPEDVGDFKAALAKVKKLCEIEGESTPDDFAKMIEYVNKQMADGVDFLKV